MLATMTEAPADSEPLALDLDDLPFRTDRGVGARANLGLLVLKTDRTIEDEFRFLLPDEGVALYAARLDSPSEITAEKLRQMEPRIGPATHLLPEIALDALGFACTSGSLVIGEATVAKHVRTVRPGVCVTDPVTAALAAIEALGAERIALLTPYLRTINLTLRAALQARGIRIPVMGSFNEADDRTVACITPESLEAAIVRLGASNACDAVFVSCTSLRVAKIVARCEGRIGKPVTSSNHALAWHMLRLAGVEGGRPEHGRLFAL